MKLDLIAFEQLIDLLKREISGLGVKEVDKRQEECVEDY